MRHTLQEVSDQQWKDDQPKFNKVHCASGTRVKIVMVSRFGDVGITEDLNAENGYGCRVNLDPRRVRCPPGQGVTNGGQY